MAAALNSQSEAARVMSVNTIATSPSGGLIPPAAPAAKAPCDAHELLHSFHPTPAMVAGEHTCGLRRYVYENWETGSVAKGKFRFWEA